MQLQMSLIQLINFPENRPLSGYHCSEHRGWIKAKEMAESLSGLFTCITFFKSTAPVCFFKKYIYLFIFGFIGSSLLSRGLSLVVASGGYSSLLCAGFSSWWLLLLRSTGSRCTGFSSCGTRAQ